MDADYIERAIDEELENINVNLSDMDSENYTDTEEDFTASDVEIKNSFPDSVFTYVEASSNRLNSFEQLILEDLNENGPTCTELPRPNPCNDLLNELTSTFDEDPVKLKEAILSEIEEQAADPGEVDQSSSDGSAVASHTYDDKTDSESYKECERKFIVEWRELEERMRREQDQRVAQLERECHLNLEGEQDNGRRCWYEKLEKICLFEDIKDVEGDCETSKGLSFELIKQQELIERLEEQLQEERHMFEKAQQEEQNRTMERRCRAATKVQAAFRGSLARRWCRSELIKRKEEERKREEKKRRREMEEGLKREQEERERRRKREDELKREQEERESRKERKEGLKREQEERERRREREEGLKREQEERERRRQREEREEGLKREQQQEEEARRVAEVEWCQREEVMRSAEYERAKERNRHHLESERVREEQKCKEEQEKQARRIERERKRKGEEEERRTMEEKRAEEERKIVQEEQEKQARRIERERKRKGEEEERRTMEEKRAEEERKIVQKKKEEKRMERRRQEEKEKKMEEEHIKRGDENEPMRKMERKNQEKMEGKGNKGEVIKEEKEDHESQGGSQKEKATVSLTREDEKETSEQSKSPETNNQNGTKDTEPLGEEQRKSEFVPQPCLPQSKKGPLASPCPSSSEPQEQLEHYVSSAFLSASTRTINSAVPSASTCTISTTTAHLHTAHLQSEADGGKGETDTRGRQCARVRSVNSCELSMQESSSCCLPDSTEQKRLAWMLSCTPWSKLTIQNRRKGPCAPVKRRPVRRAPDPSLPPLPAGAVLRCGPWSSLQQVTTVILEDLPSYSLSTLCECSRLQSLTLRRCGLQALHGLDQCSELRHIDVQENNIRYVDCGRLAQLEVLLLGRNQLTSLHGLDGATDLTELQLSHNGLSRLSGLGSLKRLQRLCVDHNQLISTRELGEVFTLLHLDCSYNHLSHVEGLENCALLNTLDLRGNSLTELPVLRNHVLLRELYVDENSVSCLQGLVFSWLPLLRCLSLTNNSITELPLLNHLLSLRTLDVSHNCLSELRGVCESVQGCSSLQDLNLSDNPLQQETDWRSSILAVKPSLVKLNGELTGVSALPSVGSTQLYSFQALCQAHQDQLDSVLQKQSIAIRLAPSLLDAHLMAGDHSVALFRLAEEQRYSHEYGDSRVWELAQNQPAVSGCPDTEQDAESLTQSPAEPAEPHTKSPAEPHTLNPAEPHTQSPAEPHTQNPAKPHTLNLAEPPEPHTQNPAEAHTQSPAEPHTQNPAEPHTQNPAEPHTQNAAEPHTQNPAEPHTQSPAEPHTQSPAEPHTQRSALHSQRQLKPHLSDSALCSHHSSADLPAAYAGDCRNPSQKSGEALLCGDEHNRYIVKAPRMHLKTTAAVVIQRWWHTCRETRCRVLTRPPANAHGKLSPFGMGSSKKRTEPLNKHYAATVIQAVWRGFSLRTRLTRALALACRSPLDEDILEEVDVSQFLTAEEAMESYPTALHYDVSLSKEPLYLGHLSLSKPPLLLSELHESAPVLPWRPKQAWTGSEAGSQRSESPGPNPRNLPPAAPPTHAALSERSEKILEEWGIRSSSTAILMLKRAQRMKARKQQQRKLLAGRAGGSVPVTLRGDSGGCCHHRSPHSSHTAALESRRSSSSSSGGRFLPELDAEVLNGGRVQLVAGAGYREGPESAVRLKDGAVVIPPPYTLHPVTLTHSQAPAAKEASSSGRATSIPPRKERISFRDNPVRQSGGWGGGKKRASVNK